MTRRLTRSIWWNWAWWLVSLAAIGVIAGHVEYGDRWVQYALNVVVITWIVPYRTPRLTPYPRCGRCHEKILPGQDTVSRLRTENGPVRWRKHTECWNEERIRNDGV